MIETPEPGAFGLMMLLCLVGLLTVSCPVTRETSNGLSAEQRISEDSVVATDDAEEDAPRGDESGGADAGDGALLEETRVGQKVALEDHPLASFFEALETSQESGGGLVRVLHYGDSHTAADFLTTAIRRALQDELGDGGRGFVLLGDPWNAYRPKDVTVSSSGEWRTERVLVAADPATLDGMYGLGGICAKSDDRGASTAVSTTRATGYGRRADTFEVFYLKQPGGGGFRVLADGEVVEEVDTDARRIGSGFVKVKVPRGEHRFEVRVNGDGQVRFFGAVMEDSAGPGVVYDTLGVNGGFFYTPLRWDETLLAEQISRRDPDLIVTMYGANEVDSRSIDPASYKAKVQTAMARFRKGAPDAACLMMGPTDRKVSRALPDGTDQLTWIIDVQREVAAQTGCMFMDLREMMGGPGSYDRWAAMAPPLAQGDGVHLTVRGYRVLGEQIGARLLSAYARRDEEGAGGVDLGDLEEER